MNKLVNKQVRTFNEINVWANVIPEIKVFDIEDKIKLKRTTLKNSAYSNEFRILNDKYGYHTSMSGARLCEYEIITIDEDEDWWGNKYKVERVVTLTNEELDYETYKKMLIENNHATLEILERIEKEWLKNQELSKYGNYLELNMTHNKLYFYLEFNNECYSLELFKGNSSDNNRLYVDGLDFNGINLKDMVEKQIMNGVFDLVDQGVQKLSNGYIYENKYYENLDDVKEVIKEEEQ